MGLTLGITTSSGGCDSRRHGGRYCLQDVIDTYGGRRKYLGDSDTVEGLMTS